MSWTLLQPDWWSSQGLSCFVNFSKRFSMSLQTRWLKNCQKAFKPVYYERYVDDIFVLFQKPEQVILFVNNLSKKHKNINFFFKTEKENLTFFDVKICIKKDKFTNSIFITYSDMYEKICTVMYTWIYIYVIKKLQYVLGDKFCWVSIFVKTFYNLKFNLKFKFRKIRKVM